MKKHLRLSSRLQSDMREICKPVLWPNESTESGETPYMQRRQRAALAALFRAFQSFLEDKYPSGLRPLAVLAGGYFFVKLVKILDKITK